MRVQSGRFLSPGHGRWLGWAWKGESTWDLLNSGVGRIRPEMLNENTNIYTTGTLAEGLGSREDCQPQAGLPRRKMNGCPTSSPGGYRVKDKAKPWASPA